MLMSMKNNFSKEAESNKIHTRYVQFRHNVLKDSIILSDNEKKEIINKTKQIVREQKIIIQKLKEISNKNKIN